MVGSPRFFGATTATGFDLQKLPKAELHVHLEGTMPPTLVKRMAATYDIELPDDLFGESDTGFPFKDFMDFLKKYDDASSVVRSTEAMTEITYEYLRHSHQQGVVYSELTVSPDHLARYDISYQETISAVVEGIDKAKAEFGIEARMIVILVRHLGVEACESLVDKILASPHGYVCGIGLAGAEAQFPPAQFAKAFAKARAAGLQVTAHAGEVTNAQDVMNAITELGVTRIGHGIQAAFDAEVLAVVKERGVHLELCPNSNHALETCQHYPETHKTLKHPISLLHAEGVRYSLNSDDPGIFGNSVHEEYRYAQTELELTPAELLKITLHAIQDSFAEPALKAELEAKVYAYARENDIRLEASRVALQA